MPSTTLQDRRQSNFSQFPRQQTLSDLSSPPPDGRGFFVHPETSYILDCSVELGEITPMEDLVFRVKTPAAFALMELTARDERLPPHWLRNTARQYLESLSREERYVWALRGSRGLEFGLRTFQERLEFVLQAKVQSDLGVAERTSIRFMDEADVEMFSEMRFLTVHDVTQNAVKAFLDDKYGETRTRLEDDLRIALEALEWLKQPGSQATARSIAETVFEELPASEPIISARCVATPASPRKMALAARKTQRRARSAIKKALRLFARTGLEDSVRMMVSGREVELSHPDSPFKFVLQPLQAGWLEQRTAKPGGHVPYQLTLLTKGDVFLSRLCVLFDQTPVLDQLLALTFFVQSGCEDEILSKANWFGYASAVDVRSVLATAAPALLEKVPAPATTSACSAQFGGISHHARLDAHWAPYKGPVRNWIGTWMSDLYTSLPNTARRTMLA